MKYIFAALVLISSVAHAQLSEYERKFTCGKTQFVISALTQNAQEKPIWAGADPQTGTQTTILLNTRTLTCDFMLPLIEWFGYFELPLTIESNI